jgi:hypothetical protein
MGGNNDPEVLFDSLFIGSYRSTANFMGAWQLKIFTRVMGEILVDDLPERVGIARESSTDPIENINRFAEVENQTGKYEGDHVTIEKSDKGYTVTFPKCPYAAPCGEVLAELTESGKFGKNQLPCIRTDIACALISESTGQKTRYVLEQFAPGFKCVSDIELI